MTVYNVQTNPDLSDWAALELLLRQAYAPMEGRIDPPSFLTGMTRDDIARKAAEEDLFLIREQTRPVACGFGHQDGTFYEIGKLAVAATHRRRGLARHMMDAATTRARTLGLAGLQLYARIELVENHATYRALGFQQVAEFSHPGFTHPTALIFRRAL
ncbi:GNAT family N-acetyltransferase [Rhodophyticola sp. CCM32]|uniref:GNAT family N-acetyltransferase n=1 Tax=Rhodophyticola sp. CCM32 TaxID=2916397 RepID=UPI00143CC9E0|nr:GNAT family N-acetyltransferase [Rhodophyticola sp. CCM32]